MSIEAPQFLNDAGGTFAEDAPRPPVPGEENDHGSHGSNSGNSTRSYNSLKSRGSSRSSGKRMSEVSHSPAATPRQSSLKGVILCDDDAPLGFEPEGSCSNSPQFTENSTPSYLKWAENLTFLLEDSDGVKLFKQFLCTENCANTLDFWFACQGFKNNVPPNDVQKIHQLIKLIYRNYIRGETTIAIKADTKKAIVDKISKKEQLDQMIFDDAQTEIEDQMKNTLYPSFLKSELYVQYVQNGGESPKTSTTASSSGSNSVRPLSGILPTVHEDSELQQADINAKVTTALTKGALLATSLSRAQFSGARKVNEGVSGSTPYISSGGKVPNPYHVSYAPVSAQDSELQSLSSDALTDETMSLTDSSVDGIPPSYHTKKWKVQQRRAMKRSAQQNKDTTLTQNIIPRTERAPKDRNIAEVDPISFAAMLTEKLEKVLKEQENMEKIKKLMNESEESEEKPMNVSGKLAPSTDLTTLMAAAAANAMAEHEANAQSILEEHVSRIWDNSAHGTPSRSPGRHTPKSKSPERAYRKLLSPGYMACVPAPSYNKTYKRKDKDYASLLSYDSGVSEPSGHTFDNHDNCSSHCKHIHHHHHHHHIRDLKSKQHFEIEAQQCGFSACYVEEHSLRGAHPPDSLPLPGHREGRARDSGKRSSNNNSKKISADSMSNVYDSGVSMAYDRSPPMAVPNLTNPSNEKVLNWMLENEKLKEYSTHTDSDRSSSHKRSHKSSTASPSQHRQGNSKKAGVAYHTSRSGSQERSGLGSWIGPDVAPVHHKKPTQPFVQDPNMPLLTPPNPTTQLEEAKRRLEKEAKMPKSRSFTGAVSKDKRPPQTLGHPAPLRQSTCRQGLEIDQPPSEGSSQPPSRQEKSQSRSSSASAPTTPGSQGEKTVVGYYLCGDPIPYRSVIEGKNITLKQFKQLITKKGNYKYFFKRASDEFETGVVHEEITDENSVLPLWEGKIVGKIEKIE
ncbi:axin-1-like isoform X2 [Lineus longissimus]|uniref:axin-1-like isoform X2 n=1 Tax=Lineus longissimus TaxID=88925 RepID=UPI002B4DBED0